MVEMNEKLICVIHIIKSLKKFGQVVLEHLKQKKYYNQSSIITNMND